VWSRPRAGLDERVAAAGARLCLSLEEAVSGTDVVFAGVPVSAASEVASACAPFVRADAIYVDPAPRPPEAKSASAAALPGYVDAAVMGTTAADGFEVAFFAAGPGAEPWRERVSPLGMNVSVLDGPAGAASLVKLLRSVYMKGRDALIVETLLAARRYGVEQELLASFAGAGEQVAFPELAERVVTAVAVHAGRRADELAASAELLREVGVEPLMAGAGEERLRRVAAQGLRERFAGERPASLEAALAALAGPNG
jgi:3-hydroxyisobutyrate dehydrogenase-like beta-hydroxyacid dehydrogenase